MKVLKIRWLREFLLTPVFQEKAGTLMGKAAREHKANDCARGIDRGQQFSTGAAFASHNQKPTLLIRRIR